MPLAFGTCSDELTFSEAYAHTNVPKNSLADEIHFTESYAQLRIFAGIDYTDSVIFADAYTHGMNKKLFYIDFLFARDTYAPGFDDTRVTGPIINPPTTRPVVVDPPTPPLGEAISYAPVHPTVHLSGSGSVDLPAPEFGDSDDYAARRIARPLRDSVHINTFRESFWPVTRILTLTWAHLTDKQAEQLRTFVVANVGQEITLRDYWNRPWSVVILNPDTEFTQSERQGKSVSLTFQWIPV